MAQFNKPDAAATVVALEARLAEALSVLEATKGHLRRALIAMEHKTPGAEEEADALSQGVRWHKDRVGALRETLEEARAVAAVQNAADLTKAAKRDLTEHRKRGQLVLDKAVAIDEALTVLGHAWRQFEEAHIALWSEATPDIRSLPLADYMQGHSEVIPSIKLRLGLEGVLSGAAPMDRTQPLQTVGDRLSKVLQPLFFEPKEAA